MKNGSVLWWNLILAAVALSFGAGCVEGAASSEQAALVSNQVAAVSDLTTNVATVGDQVDTNAPSTGVPESDVPDITKADVKPIITERRLPPTIRSNSPVADIMKLVESGVEESVLLSFITNSTSIYNLTADDIIYLNDIGISGAFVTAILEHDKALRAASLTSVWSEQAPAPVETTNHAPQDLAPQDMAPQVAEQPPPAQEEPAAPPSTVTYNNFYSSLSPYGTWVEVDGYGRCWQPSAVVVNPYWQPYMNGGHWAYTDYGWYWASDYSWGWAPFHYGRWFRHNRLGWCWYPDTVWGPSWVSWRYTSAYCGWAPLPPCAWYSPGIGLTYWGSHVGVSFTFGLSAGCYSFVSWNHFHDHHPYDHAVPYGHRQQIYDKSVVATRISGTRNNVFNHGIAREQVERATGTRINRVAVHEVSTPRAGGGRPDRLSSDGRSLTAYRPRLSEANREMPLAVRERAQRPAGGSGLAENSISRPGSASRVNPSSVVATRDSTPVRVSRTDVAQDDAIPQRPVSAASLARPSNSLRSVQRPDPTSVARSETSAPESPLNSRDGLTTSPQHRDTPATPAPATARTRTQSQQNQVATIGQPNSRSVERVEPTRPAMQRPQSSLPNNSASQSRVPTYQAPNTQAPQVPRYAPNANTRYQQPSRSVAETPRYAPTTRSEPVRPNTATPSYQAPVRNYNQPQPSYQAPRQAASEAPRYSAPPTQRAVPDQSQQFNNSARAPQQSTPAQASPRSSSPQSNSGRQQQQQTR